MVKKYSFGEVVFSVIKWTILIFACLIVIVPTLHVFSASFSSADALIDGVYLFPKDISLTGYESAFNNPKIMLGLRNTVIYVVLGSVLNTILTILAAYPLSRKDLPGKKAIMMIFTFTMLFNGGMIPTYMVVMKLGLLDTIAAMILVDAINVWIMIVMRTYFQSTIPNDLYEAASIDGCNDINVLWRVVLPLSKAIIAVSLLMYGVAYWNGYFNGVLYLKSDDLAPLQLVLKNLLLSTEQMSADTMSTMNPDQYLVLLQLKYVLKYSCIVISTVPMLCIYPFVQKYFVKGVMIGSIKG